MVKKLILVTSPPACGKTYISKALAARLEHVVYLDKDTLITLSKQIFKVANQPYNRSSQFFEDNIRDYEYDCVVDLALEALDYEKNATLVVVWVETSPEIVHKRMIDRNSDRDTWKLEHWDEYIAGCNFEIPENLKRPGAKDSLIIFKNNNEKEFENSMKKCVSILDETMNEDSLQQVG